MEDEILPPERRTGIVELATALGRVAGQLDGLAGQVKANADERRAMDLATQERITDLHNCFEDRIKAVHDDLTPVLNDYLLRKKKHEYRQHQLRRLRVWVVGVVALGAGGALTVIFISWYEHLATWLRALEAGTQ